MCAVGMNMFPPGADERGESVRSDSPADIGRVFNTANSKGMRCVDRMSVPVHSVEASVFI